MRVLQTALCLKILFILRPEEVCQISLCVCVCVCVSARFIPPAQTSRKLSLRGEGASFPDTNTNTYIKMHRWAYQACVTSILRNVQTHVERQKDTNAYTSKTCARVPQTLHLVYLQTRNALPVVHTYRTQRNYLLT